MYAGPMDEQGDGVFGRRALGAALVAGATGAGLALSFARPMVRDGLEAAAHTSGGLRRASVEVAKGATRAAFDAARPTFESALEAKDRLRRRAVGSLPTGFGGMLEEWRREFIEGEKAVYFGGRQMAGDLRPALDAARARSWAMLESALGTFGDVVDTSLVTMVKMGEGLQAPQRPKREAPKPGKKRARRS